MVRLKCFVAFLFIFRCGSFMLQAKKSKFIGKMLSDFRRPIERELDRDFMESLDDISSRVARTCQSLDEIKASDLKSEIRDLIPLLEEEKDLRTVYFLKQVTMLLNHDLPSGAEDLVGPYKAAWNRITTALVGSMWRIGDSNDRAEENESHGKSDYKFPKGQNEPDKMDDGNFYERLKVAKNASFQQIKSSYRSLAMKVHPDVSDEEDSHERFIKLSEAYDVLSNPELRSKYDIYGEKGLKERYNQGSSPSEEMWEELSKWVEENRKPKKPGKRQLARDQVNKFNREAEWKGWEGVPESLRKGKALFGDVVKYPLSQAVKDDLQDGREIGLGVVVGRNIDRGDASKIPFEVLELCEVEPLEYVDGRWRPDCISASAYPKLSDLEIVEVLSHEKCRVGENGGWYALLEDLQHLSPQNYYEEIIV